MHPTARLEKMCCCEYAIIRRYVPLTLASDWQNVVVECGGIVR